MFLDYINFMQSESNNVMKHETKQSKTAQGNTR